MSAESQDKSVKRRAACDECRSKKLKCTGEQPACARCVRESIACVYSPQKQMGRPKKRARQEDDLDLVGWSDGRHRKSSRQDNEIPSITAQTLSNGNGDTIQNGWDGFSGLDLTTADSLALLQPLGLPSTQSLDLHTETENGLTPDTHAESPYSHGLLQTIRDGPNELPFDPAMQTFSTLNGPNCACLSTLYLTLNTLQGMDSSFTFPFALHPLREAMQVGAEVISCQECPKRFITGIQNTQILGTLLLSIAERFGKVLENITLEAQRAKDAGQNKKFRLADLNTTTSHLHHGGLGCRAAFNIDLEPHEWRMMAKKVVKAEVYGPNNSSTSSHSPPGATEPSHCPGGAEGEHTDCPYFLGLTQSMYDRQMKWHKGPPPTDIPKDKDGKAIGGRNIPTEEHICLKMPTYARKVVESFDWL